MKKNTRFTMVMATAVMLLALTGCEVTGGDTTVTTPAPTVEATPTETSVDVTPTEEPAAEAAPTEDVAAPTEAPAASSNLEWEVVDSDYDGNLTILGTFRDGETIEVSPDEHYYDSEFSLKTEKVIQGVDLISENNNFGLNDNERFFSQAH